MTKLSCSRKNFMALFYALRGALSRNITYKCANFFIEFNVNGIFAAVFLLSAVLFLIYDPNGFLPALLTGGEKAATLSLSLLAVYCVWLGFFKVLEKCGLAERLSRGVYPLAGKLFRSNDKEAVYLAGCNLSANFLGLPGAPTPLGIKATEKFCAAGNDYAADMLFVLNATSLQLLPTTVIALRLSAGSAAPADIFLPTLLATLLSTLLGASLVWVTGIRRGKRRARFLARARR